MSADAIVSTALAFAGLSYVTDPDRYAATLFPTDAPAVAHQMASVDYSCALTARAVLAFAGVDGTCAINGKTIDVLREPYAYLTGLAVALLIELAQARGVWNKAPSAADLQPGVVLLITAPEHVIVIVGRDEADGVVTLQTVEGGNLDPITGHGTAIRAKTRQVVVHGGQLVVGRPVRGCFQAGDLPTQPDAASDEPMVDATGSPTP